MREYCRNQTAGQFGLALRTIYCRPNRNSGNHLFPCRILDPVSLVCRPDCRVGRARGEIGGCLSWAGCGPVGRGVGRQAGDGGCAPHPGNRSPRWRTPGKPAAAPPPGGGNRQ